MNLTELPKAKLDLILMANLQQNRENQPTQSYAHGRKGKITCICEGLLALQTSQQIYISLCSWSGKYKIQESLQEL